MTSLLRTFLAGKPVAILISGKKVSRLVGYLSLSLFLSLLLFFYLDLSFSHMVPQGPHRGLRGQNLFHNTKMSFFSFSFSHDYTVKFSRCYMSRDNITDVNT